MRSRIFTICLLTLLSTACVESLPRNFDDIAGIYFSNTASNRMLSDSADYTFVYEADTVDFIPVPVKLQLLGRSADRERKINITIHSDNATEGKDYKWISPLSLPADSTELELIIAVYRSPELKEKEKSISLELVSSDELILPFTHHNLSNGESVSAVSYTIRFSEMFTAPPQGWRTMFAGTFSQAKFELLCKVSGVDRKLFNSPNALSDAKWMYMRSRVLEYILEQENLRAAGLEYDHDAFDENGTALDFSK